MKIRNIFLALLTVALISGCEDDDKNKNEFSDLEVEEHKQNLEESGLAVMNQLEPMADMEAVHVTNYFMGLMETTFDGGGDVASVLQPVAQLKKGADAAFNLKATTDEPETLAQVFNEHSGIYTFDFSTERWNKEASDQELTFHFPTEGSNENNATLSFTNFSYIENPNDEMSADFPELVQSVDGTLSVDDQEMVSIEWRGSYDEDGLATNLSESITMQGYVISTTFDRNDSKVSYDQSFVYQDEDILTSSITVGGNFDYNTLSSLDDDVPFEEQQAIMDANVEVTADNIKFEGLADWGAIQEEMNNAMSGSDDEEQAESNFMELMVDVLNENVNLFVRYADNNKIIAKSEFYIVEETDDAYAEYTDRLDMRMVFEDGSAIDDSFFGSGFGNLIERANQLVSQAEENYGITIE